MAISHTEMTVKSLENIEKIKSRKDLAPLFAKIEAVEAMVQSVSLDDCISIVTNNPNSAEILSLAKELMPWRKGPFKIDKLFIDTEWRSFIKYNYLKPYFDLSNKKVADIGANNGYYSFRMLDEHPSSVTIFEPYAPYFAQFAFLDRFIKSGIRFELLGVEDLMDYGEKFDVIFCLGVVYHRNDPISSLKALRKGLAEEGELFVDCLIIDGDDEKALCPVASYAKMSNVYFVPTKKSFEGWLARAGFECVEFLGQMPTTTDEQRRTEWIGGQSLNDFLSADGSMTVEGYPPPLRAYYKCKTRR